MTYDIYRYIFIGAAILCGIMFLLSVYFFIFFKIPSVIGDLTGANARKAIKNIREQNEASGNKGYRVSGFNEARGRLTDKISGSGRIVQRNAGQMAGINTEKISTAQLTSDSENLTTVLDNSFHDETTVLHSPEETCENASFEIEYEITFIHTDEIISAEEYI